MAKRKKKKAKKILAKKEEIKKVAEKKVKYYDAIKSRVKKWELKGWKVSKANQPYGEFDDLVRMEKEE